jgi:hypothetical protein
MTGVFDPGFSFNATSSIRREEIRSSAASLRCRRSVLWRGWLFRDGRLGLVHARKRAARARESLLPETIELAAEDEFERPLQLQVPWSHRARGKHGETSNANFCPMRWESAGRITYGDCQEPLRRLLHFIAARVRGIRVHPGPAVRGFVARRPGNRASMPPADKRSRGQIEPKRAGPSPGP